MEKIIRMFMAFITIKRRAHAKTGNLIDEPIIWSELDLRLISTFSMNRLCISNLFVIGGRCFA